MGMGLAALAFFSAAFADDQDHEGWYVEVEVASSTPGNVNTPVLTSVAADGARGGGGTPPFENEVFLTDFDADASFRVGVGHSWGKKGRLQVTYWSYSSDEDLSGFAPSYYVSGGNNYNWFGIGPTSSIGYTFYYDTDFDVNQEIKASTIDVEFLRDTSPGENVTITWGIGLRIASFEDEIRGRYLSTTNGPTTYEFPVSREIDSDGVGVTGSVGVEYMFGQGDRVGISSRLRVGFLTADVEASHSVTDLDGYDMTAGSVWRESAEREDETATTLEYEANVVIRLAEKLSLDVGWASQTWTDLAQVPLNRTFDTTGDQTPGVLLDEGRDRISWSGPRIRARIRF
jgi:hypothetical protein